jgi:glutamate racemase
MKSAPIGIFDSGVGGLSVLREIRALLPGEDLLYVADSGYAPYGDRDNEFILQRAETIATFFVSQGVKAMVVACNTATAVAVRALRAQHEMAIVAMEPALKPAAEKSSTGVIAILATSRTLVSDSFARLADKYGEGLKVLLQACPGFVELVENAELDKPKTAALVESYLVPLLAQGADTFVLGCTHYPFLTPVIRSVCGQGVRVIDPSPAVARELRRRLMSAGLLSVEEKPGTERFWTSGIPGQVQKAVERLWGNTVNVEAVPAAFG